MHHFAFVNQEPTTLEHTIKAKVKETYRYVQTWVDEGQAILGLAVYACCEVRQSVTGSALPPTGACLPLARGGEGRLQGIAT